jgi:hypothetical protein
MVLVDFDIYLLGSTMTKRTIRKTEYLSLEDFEGTIDEVITRLQEIKEEGWEGIEVNYYYEFTSYNKYKHRLETDREYKSRLYDEELNKSRRREQYLKLKKEFENE